MALVCLYFFAAGLWIGLLPYMLLRYRDCDLLGRSCDVYMLDIYEVRP
jgi:hypothetical protein